MTTKEPAPTHPPLPSPACSARPHGPPRPVHSPTHEGPRPRPGRVPSVAPPCRTADEGGIGATPGEEAHGGYTFCGLAALVLLGDTSRLRVHALLDWLAQRQMGAHGGFQGRTNKLVDGCYSFWQGGAFPLVRGLLAAQDDLGDDSEALFCSRGLLDYILVCTQAPQGGLRDKPGRGRDYYHTCYCLSGLAVAAAEPATVEDAPPPEHWTRSVQLVNAVYNVSAPKAEAALAYFAAAGRPAVAVTAVDAS